MRRAIALAAALLAAAARAGEVCGDASRPARIESRIEWRNRHGRYVSRLAALRGQTLLLCKRPPAVDESVPLGAAAVEVTDGDARLTIRAMHPRGRVAELRLGSAAEATAWAEAMRASAGAMRGSVAGAAYEAESIRGTAADNAPSASDAAADAAIAACHRRAMQYGARGLGHTAELPNAHARQRFRRSCMAAAGGAAWSAGVSRTRRPRFHPACPSVCQSGGAGTPRLCTAALRTLRLRGPMALSAAPMSSNSGDARIRLPAASPAYAPDARGDGYSRAARSFTTPRRTGYDVLLYVVRT